MFAEGVFLSIVKIQIPFYLHQFFPLTVRDCTFLSLPPPFPSTFPLHHYSRCRTIRTTVQRAEEELGFQMDGIMGRMGGTLLLLVAPMNKLQHRMLFEGTHGIRVASPLPAAWLISTSQEPVRRGGRWFCCWRWPDWQLWCYGHLCPQTCLTPSSTSTLGAWRC